MINIINKTKDMEGFMTIKYDNLTEYLNEKNLDEITITYKELKEIIGGLTNSLLKYGHTFFNNNSLRNNYFKYWYNAGYLAFPDVKNQKVTFKKGVEPEHTERNKTLNNYKNIRKPCQEEVDKYLRNWETLNSSKYKYQEDSLELLYKTFPLNNKLEEILFKASTLNDFYSTNIFSIIEVCQHIK